jgi:sugar lactone lactonase YvrE
MPAQLYIDARHSLAEGPVWHQGNLYWVNITAGRLYRHDTVSAELSHFDVGTTLGVALPARDGWWWCAREQDCAWLHEPSGQIAPIAAPVVPPVPTAHRFNDGFSGPDGHPWVGSAALDGSRETAALYRADASGALQRALPNITLSNGLGWSPDGQQFYYVDSPARKLSVFDYDRETHELSNHRALREFPDDGTVPDGLSIDRDGHIWLAIWGGSAVLRIHSQTGEILDRVEVPVTQVTSCCFGGADGSTLFITTARGGLDADALAAQPYAGSIFQVQTNTAGLPPVHCSLPTPHRQT